MSSESKFKQCNVRCFSTPDVLVEGVCAHLSIKNKMTTGNSTLSHYAVWSLAKNTLKY